MLECTMKITLFFSALLYTCQLNASLFRRGFTFPSIKSFFMIIPLIALAGVFIFLILFFVFAGKKKSRGEDLGDSLRNPMNRPFNQQG